MRNEKYFDNIVKSSLLLILKYLKDGNVVVILKDFSTPAHLIKYLCTLCRTKSSHSSFHEITTEILSPISINVISMYSNKTVFQRPNKDESNHPA